MATKKTKKADTGEWPKVIRGSHSIRTEHEDGRVEFETIWEELVNDVNQALREYQVQQLESIDPDERTWYYDEYGTRRKKEETPKKKTKKVKDGK